MWIHSISLPKKRQRYINELDLSYPLLRGTWSPYSLSVSVMLPILPFPTYTFIPLFNFFLLVLSIFCLVLVELNLQLRSIIEVPIHNLLLPKKLHILNEIFQISLDFK